VGKGERGGRKEGREGEGRKKGRKGDISPT